MAYPPRAFVSFDYDNDSSLRDLLIGQSKHSDTNFELHDWSVKEPFAKMLGNIIYGQLVTANNQPLAAALSIIPLAAIVLYLLAMRRTGALENV